MDTVKTRKAAAAKACWLQYEVADGGSPNEGELTFLLDYANPDEHLSDSERELLRLAYLALQNDYVVDGPLEFPDEQERKRLTRELVD